MNFKHCYVSTPLTQGGKKKKRHKYYEEKNKSYKKSQI